MSFENLFESLRNLPVATIAEHVTKSVLAGAVTTLSSATGSGKTLFQTAHLAEALDEQVVVLVPRRFLAVNAAEIVADLSGCEIGTKVGYAVGSQTGDRSRWDKNETKLLFATNGFALASGLVQTAKAFVLDEVHETSMDLSIIRALLRRRIEQGEAIKLLEMSATMDSQRQANYWHGVTETKVFAIDGKTYDCDFRHRPASKVEDEVMRLIDEGKRGILVFRPGVGEVEETVEEIISRTSAASKDVEVAKIYGDMNYSERQTATANPTEGKVKVLVGTNVVESGANISWLDAGVTCGTGKENSVRPETDATYLELVELPRWRLKQQEGRVNRFRPGVFVLCAQKAFAEREQATKPEIERLALTELVMHCAGFGLRTHELTFDYAPNPGKILDAEQKLQRLGMIGADCALTQAGKFITELPIGPETGAMLWHAKQIGCVNAILPLLAVIEVGGLRKNFKEGHYLDSNSDLLDSLLAFRKAFQSHGKERKEVMETNNISFKRFDAACDLLRDLERRLEILTDFQTENKLPLIRQSILAGSVEKLFLVMGYRGDVVSIKNQNASYRLGQGSSVWHLSNQSIVAGDLRVITPRDKFKSAFTILEKVSLFTFEDLQAVANVRPEILVEEKLVTEEFMNRKIDHIGYKLFGKHVVKQMAVPQNHHLENDHNLEPKTFGDLWA